MDHDRVTEQAEQVAALRRAMAADVAWRQAGGPLRIASKPTDEWRFTSPRIPRYRGRQLGRSKYE